MQQQDTIGPFAKRKLPNTIVWKDIPSVANTQELYETAKSLIRTNIAPLDLNKSSVDCNQQNIKDEIVKDEFTIKDEIDVKLPLEHNSGNDFSNILKGMKFSISGLVNPLRAQIRNYGIEMGAKVQSDWDQSCTAIICPFKKSPKITAAKSQGEALVLHQQYILDCFETKERLGLKAYLMNEPNDPLENYSEKEIQKIAFKDVSQERVSWISKLEPLADFFKGMEFYLDPSLNEEMTRISKRYILAYDGDIVEDADKKYVIHSKMMMPREIFEKYASEVQTNIVTQSKRLSQAKASIASLTKQQKLSLLTSKELEQLPEECPTYRAVGKMFILENIQDIRQELNMKSQESAKQLPALVALVSKTETELKESKEQMKELIKRATTASE